MTDYKSIKREIVARAVKEKRNLIELNEMFKQVKRTAEGDSAYDITPYQKAEIIERTVYELFFDEEFPESFLCSEKAMTSPAMTTPSTNTRPLNLSTAVLAGQAIPAGVTAVECETDDSKETPPKRAMSIAPTDAKRSYNIDINGPDPEINKWKRRSCNWGHIMETASEEHVASSSQHSKRPQY
ncbi:hypothetical protein SBOR_7117 [Sclerotinia borealis F-4128]|uniref:Uncharacterized protein n=1 Tax=Sclerotinia borealis (strain F-4128) TaxID=1432307 RepID=W9C6V3_SCLBF|nr:hypothetical protein SBOR_7117 [Sclerotinia borealis F-4128]